MRINVKEIEDLLVRTFNGAKKFAMGTGARAGYGLVQHGTGFVAKEAVKSLKIELRDGTILSYEHLSTEDQKIVDEIVQYATRFSYQYADHHDEHTAYRMEHHAIDQIIADHASEICQAAIDAANQRIRSLAYDDGFGKPPSSPIFNDEVIVKQLVQGAIMEAWYELSERQRQLPPE